MSTKNPITKVWLARALICLLALLAVSLAAVFPLTNLTTYSGALEDTWLSDWSEEKKRLAVLIGGGVFFFAMLALAIRVVKQAFRSSTPWTLFARD